MSTVIRTELDVSQTVAGFAKVSESAQKTYQSIDTFAKPATSRMEQFDAAIAQVGGTLIQTAVPSVGRFVAAFGRIGVVGGGAVATLTAIGFGVNELTKRIKHGIDEGSTLDSLLKLDSPQSGMLERLLGKAANAFVDPLGIGIKDQAELEQKQLKATAAMKISFRQSFAALDEQQKNRESQADNERIAALVEQTKSVGELVKMRDAEIAKMKALAETEEWSAEKQEASNKRQLAFDQKIADMGKQKREFDKTSKQTDESLFDSQRIENARTIAEIEAEILKNKQAVDAYNKRGLFDQESQMRYSALDTQLQQKLAAIEKDRLGYAEQRRQSDAANAFDLQLDKLKSYSALQKEVRRQEAELESLRKSGKMTLEDQQRIEGNIETLKKSQTSELIRQREIGKQIRIDQIEAQIAKTEGKQKDQADFVAKLLGMRGQAAGGGLGGDGAALGGPGQQQAGQPQGWQQWGGPQRWAPQIQDFWGQQRGQGLRNFAGRNGGGMGGGGPGQAADDAFGAAIDGMRAGGVPVDGKMLRKAKDMAENALRGRLKKIDEVFEKQVAELDNAVADGVMNNADADKELRRLKRQRNEDRKDARNARPQEQADDVIAMQQGVRDKLLANGDGQNKNTAEMLKIQLEFAKQLDAQEAEQRRIAAVTDALLGQRKAANNQRANNR